VKGDLDSWFDALQSRHLADLEWAEVTRALRALSSAYVQRRAKLGSGAALDGRGKRAAFALFYGPLHFATVASILERLRSTGASICTTARIVDLGCGTGAAGAAWSLACGRAVRVSGIDMHPWVVAEAAWTYQFFGIAGTARRADAGRIGVPADSATIAAYCLNELDAAARSRILSAAAASRQPLLVVEPIARGVTPWWGAAAAEIVAYGGRADDWKLPLDMPERWRLLDRAAGFRRDHLSARTLWLPPRP
jgi:SAM-dependent methyltransferase